MSFLKCVPISPHKRTIKTWRYIRLRPPPALSAGKASQAINPSRFTCYRHLTVFIKCGSYENPWTSSASASPGYAPGFHLIELQPTHDFLSKTSVTSTDLTTHSDRMGIEPIFLLDLSHLSFIHIQYALYQLHQETHFCVLLTLIRLGSLEFG